MKEDVFLVLAGLNLMCFRLCYSTCSVSLVAVMPLYYSGTPFSASSVFHVFFALALVCVCLSFFC